MADNIKNNEKKLTTAECAIEDIWHRAAEIFNASTSRSKATETYLLDNNLVDPVQINMEMAKFVVRIFNQLW